MKREEVEKYYDEWTSRYLDVYGDVIQAFRPSNTEELLDYTIGSAGIADGMRVLDAGCGVCGPATHFASRLQNLAIEAVTISQVQVEEGRKKVIEAGVANRVRVEKGDYHRLDQIFEPESFDLVLFLESLGHAEDPGEVIRAASEVVKPGSCVYIKDFFPLETKDEYVKGRVAEVIDNINRLYSYNVLDLHETLSSLRKNGFLIDTIKCPSYENDVGIRAAFEDQFGIDIYGGGSAFLPAEWLEIRCRKISWNNGYEDS